MMQLRAAMARGYTNAGWLEAYHSFSFGHYYDPNRMGHSVLRVINQDCVAPASGFATHPHANMEILTYVLQGSIEHRDSLGHIEQIHAGEFQLMSAGAGIRHSEVNPSATQPLALLQIWLEPNEHDSEPRYQQRPLPAQAGLTLVASPTGAEGSFTLRQQACVWRLHLAAGESVRWPLAGSHGYAQVIHGNLTANGLTAQAGDGIASQHESVWLLVATEATEALLFDLP
jgi:redox-sensitive bicupin YhaK (pirin superfamily)